MINEDYCSYEVAKLLKEKGFDEPCVSKYCTDGSFDRAFHHYKNSEINKDAYNAPTHQMAMKWLREKGYIIEPQSSFISSLRKLRWNTVIYRIPQRTAAPHLECITETFLQDTYEEAVESALLYILENLI